MTTQHDSHWLGAYVLGALDQQEVRAVEQHLASCPRCRSELTDLRGMHAALGEVPPEALLDGPPEGGDLMLQRTLREVRAERNAKTRRQALRVGVAAVVIAVAFVGGGAVVGRITAPPSGDNVAAPPPTTQQPLPEGTRTVSGTDTATGAKMAVTVKPAAGWVRLNAMVSGIPQGQKCRIFVVSRDGTREEAGSWLVSKAGETDGTSLDGEALVAPADVAAVEVENFGGKKFVSVPL